MFNLFAGKNGANMLVKVNGVEGDYLVKNESSITQFIKDKNGEHTGESVLHIITDSIENSEDRNEISRKIEEFI